MGIFQVTFLKAALPVSEQTTFNTEGTAKPATLIRLGVAAGGVLYKSY